MADCWGTLGIDHWTIVSPVMIRFGMEFSIITHESDDICGILSKEFCGIPADSCVTVKKHKPGYLKIYYASGDDVDKFETLFVISGGSLNDGSWEKESFSSKLIIKL